MEINIKSILGGISESFYIGNENSFNSSIACDPDQPISAANVKSSASIVPVGYSKFSSTGLTGYPKWIITNIKNALVYVYDSAGNLLSYDSGLTTETPIGTAATSSGNGGVYYNDYLYLMANTNVSRYGPLSGNPALTDGVWTGATLGSLTALSNSSYPVLRGTAMPNHSAKVHSDGNLYFLDFATGQGRVHKIKTTSTGTNNGSAYDVLDLPFGYYPTCIESYGTDLVIGAIQTSSDTVTVQGSAALFFWNTLAPSFYAQVEVPDPIVSALKFVNGLYVFSGNTKNGVRVSKYLGGSVLQQVAYQSEGMPPFAGAVDSMGNKIVFGSYCTYPESAAVVYSYGSLTNLPMKLHCIARSTSTGANGNVTALKITQQDAGLQPKMCIGAGSDTEKILDKYSSSATLASVFRSQVFTIGKSFTIKKIRLPLGATLAANMTIICKLFFDDASSSNTLNTINSTNYSGRHVVLNPENTGITTGVNNFFIEFRWTNSVSCPILLPITISIDIFDP